MATKPRALNKTIQSIHFSFLTSFGCLQCEKVSPVQPGLKRDSIAEPPLCNWDLGGGEERGSLPKEVSSREASLARGGAWGPWGNPRQPEPPCLPAPGPLPLPFLAPEGGWKTSCAEGGYGSRGHSRLTAFTGFSGFIQYIGLCKKSNTGWTPPAMQPPKFN